jgi:nucleotide sugar dehydrogenase
VSAAAGRRVVVVGQGYVGLPVAVRAAEAGFAVLGFELDQTKFESLNSGRSYVEDISDGRLQAVLGSHYRPSCDPADLNGFEVAVISVPTPLTDHRPDLSFIERAAHDLGPAIRSGATVILESTTYPGTTEEVVRPILEERSGLVAGDDFFLGYSPERIDPGNQRWQLETTPKVVSGINDASLERVDEFFGHLVAQTVRVRGTREAELCKLLENTFRHVNIALVNELAMYSHDLGIDIWDVIEAAGTKPFGFMSFYPGPGVGGHCLPIDPSYLSWSVRRRLGHTFRFVELANDINDHMPNYVVRRVAELLNHRGQPVRGLRVVLLGIAYKRNTGDARESPGVRVAELLQEWGAVVAVADPHVQTVPDAVERIEWSRSEAERADAVVVVTDHDEFDFELLRDVQGVVLNASSRAIEGIPRL